MSYSTKESSISGGEPYFLYEFNTNNEAFLFTDHPTALEWDGRVWNPHAIKHNEVKQSSELSKNSLMVAIPIEGEFAEKFIGWAPDHIVTFTLRRGHFGAVETLVYWKGRIASHNLKGQVIELTCESVFTSMRRSGIRARFQRNCRHAVYTEGCGVIKEDFKTEGMITGFSGLTLTIPEAASQPNGWFLGGAIEFPDGSFRMILNHTASQITISRASRFVLDQFSLSGYGKGYGMFYGGALVKMYPGCSRTLDECYSKFNNGENQGGFKWIPSKNPMGGSSII